MQHITSTNHPTIRYKRLKSSADILNSTGTAQNKATRFSYITKQCVLCKNANSTQSRRPSLTCISMTAPPDILSFLGPDQSLAPILSTSLCTRKRGYRTLSMSTFDETQASSFAQFQMSPGLDCTRSSRPLGPTPASPLYLPWAFIGQRFRHYYITQRAILRRSLLPLARYVRK